MPTIHGIVARRTMPKAKLQARSGGKPAKQLTNSLLTDHNTVNAFATAYYPDYRPQITDYGSQFPTTKTIIKLSFKAK